MTQEEFNELLDWRERLKRWAEKKHEHDRLVGMVVHNERPADDVKRIAVVEKNWR